MTVSANNWIMTSINYLTNVSTYIHWKKHAMWGFNY